MESEDPQWAGFALPLWISVSITVVVALPFGLWLGSANVPLFIAFVVWTEYFALGARKEALKVMVPAYLCGVVGGTLAVIISLAADRLLGGAELFTHGDLGWITGLFIAFIPLIYAMKFLRFTQGDGGLPYFNGITMGMATYFVGGYAHYAGIVVAPGHDLVVPLVTAVPAMVGGLLGAFLGWFNIAIMKPIGRG